MSDIGYINFKGEGYTIDEALISLGNCVHKFLSTQLKGNDKLKFLGNVQIITDISDAHYAIQTALHISED